MSCHVMWSDVSSFYVIDAVHDRTEWKLRVACAPGRPQRQAWQKNMTITGYLPALHRILRLPQNVTLQNHQILRLPRRMILMIDIRDIWNVIYNARSNKHHPATSPNTAPATQNGSHDWSSSHMERHLQCAEQQASPSNLTKYCACHAKVHSKI